MITCPNCSHFKMCSVITTFKSAIKKHLKLFRPSEDPSPTEKLYSVIAESCLDYKVENK